MKFIRKALWPTAIVAAALMLFGALGNAINADTLGNVQSSTGDNVVEAGEEVAIYVVVSADADVASATKAAVNDAVAALVAADTARAITTATADLDKALKVIFPDDLGDEAAALAAANTAKQNDDTLPDVVPSDYDFNGDGDQMDMAPIFGAGDNLNDQGEAVEEDSGLIAQLRAAVIAVADATNVDTGVTRQAAVDAAAKLITDLDDVKASTGPATAQEYTVEVDGNAEITKVLTAVNKLTDQRSGRTSADVTPVPISADDAKSDLLKGFDLPAGGLLLVVVECTSGGFDISFDSDSAAGIGETASFDCQGSVAGAEISASKSTLGTSGSSAESVITVTIEDEDGTAATPGGDVEFTTNACVFGNDKKRTDSSV